MNETEELKKKYFPRVPWTAEGPVRRRYRAKPAEGSATVTEALAALARRAGFIEPGREPVIGGPAETLAAFRGGKTGMVFGTSPEAFWCDIACGEPDGEGYALLLVRSEEGENLTALAYGEGVLSFRRA